MAPDEEVAHRERWKAHWIMEEGANAERQTRQDSSCAARRRRHDTRRRRKLAMLVLGRWFLRMTHFYIWG